MPNSRALPLGLASAVAFAFGLAAAPAMACDPNAPPITQAELLEAEQTFLTSQSPLQRLSAYGVMLRTQDPNVRNHVIGLGMKDEIVQPAALRCRFFAANAFTVATQSFTEATRGGAPLSEKEKTLLEEGFRDTIAVTFRDAQQSCVSFKNRSKSCSASRMASLQDRSVVMTAANIEARFTLSSEGRLLGVLSVLGGTYRGSAVPAELFLE